nr:unnamed protein product [Callosobruchus chinensis]
MKRRRQNRLIWIYPINEPRNEVRTFYRLFKQLIQDYTKFLNYFGMSITSFDELHVRIKVSIQRKNTKITNCIQPCRNAGNNTEVRTYCLFYTIYKSSRTPK